MENDDKPFECTIPGCGQRFANNDHLAVHKQKHQLKLSLGTPRVGDTVVEDQTPTPTRFLKNLDESGLFADLDRDNPFDQEFKRVSQSDQNSKGNKQRPVETLERTSHASVPSSVIIMDQSDSTSTPALSTSAVHIQVVTTTAGSDVIKSSQNLPINVVRCIPAAIPASIANPNIPVPAAHAAITTNRSGLHIPVSSISVGQVPVVVTSPNSNSANFMSSAKQRLKESLRQQQSNNIISRAMTEATVDMSGDRLENGNVPDEHQQDTKRPVKRPARRPQEDLDPDIRRKKFLERNRAAATRCREKRKIWVTQLEKKAEELNQTNSQLQGEISLLRTEVAQLKALLLAHKECPVTIQQQKMGGLVQSAGQLINIGSSNQPFVGVSSTSLAEDTAKSALMQMATQTVDHTALSNMNSVTVVTLPQ